jgi:RNA polymerase sigma factor (sigma-70 family)
MDEPELELLERWAAGDPQAGDRLCERLLPMVSSYFRQRARSEHEDLIQQTFLACVEARSRYRGDASFKTYVLAIARHQLWKHVRQAARGRAFGVELLPAHEELSPSEAVARNRQVGALALALASMPADMQVALELAYFEDLRAPEIAARLAIPLNTVYSRLRRARELLRERLASDAVGFEA